MACKLPPNQQLVAPGKWLVVGEKAPRADPSPWELAVTGLVEAPRVWSLEELQRMPAVTRAVDIHCVTRWSKPDVRFEGIPLASLLGRARPLPEAEFVTFAARSERGHSTSLRLEDALALETLIALRADGEPLPPAHGGPVRTVVPGRYFYKSLKWLERIELLATDRLGYWEAGSGYHNVGDPWREERYALPDLDRLEVRRVLETRDVRGRELRSIAADGRELDGLDARRAVLRDARFRRARLERASFDGANLSNAHFEGADLRRASFTGADLEGADFRGADLRGADLSGAALSGATFFPEAEDFGPWGPARLDASTRIDGRSIEDLTPRQQELVRQALSARSAGP